MGVWSRQAGKRRREREESPTERKKGEIEQRGNMRAGGREGRGRICRGYE